MTETQHQFMLAVTQGDTTKVGQMLDQEPTLVETRSEQDVTALLMALYYGKRDMAEFLADHGAPLSILEATALGRVEQVNALLTAQPDLANAVSPDGFQPLGYAAFFGQPAVAAVLVAHGADVNAPSQNAMRVRPLHSATASGQLDTVRLLLRHGADPNAVQENDFTPLHNAAQTGDRPMLELLLAHGAQVHAHSRDGRTAIDFAREAGHQSIVEWLAQL